MSATGTLKSTRPSPDWTPKAVTTVAHDTQPDAWRDFRGVQWRHSIDVRSFVQENYTPYDGDASFLTGPTERTTAVYGRLAAMLREERRRANYDVNATTP
jgi:formate C-acetyltransferase